MNLQKKLIQLSEYKCSFKYVESYFLVSMVYPESWSVIPSEDRTIEVADEDGVTFYAAPIETDIENAFKLIDDTIAYNLDVEKKMALLKYNIGKLQELFAEKDLEELETIEFTFKSKKTSKSTAVQPKKTKKTSKSARKKNVKQETEELLGKPTDIFENEENLIVNDNPQYLYGLSGSGNCSDECTEEGMSLVSNNDNIPTENKYLEEVER